VYFGLYWSGVFDRFAINHKPAFSDFDGKLEIVDGKGNTLSLDNLSKRDLWIILTQYWYSVKKKSASIESIDDWVDRMSDITHGLGTNLVGSIIGLFIWIGLVVSHGGYESQFITPLVVVVWLFFICISAKNYRVSHIGFERLINTTTREVIKNQLDNPYLSGKLKILYVK
jgi:hypothetical protein